MSRITEDTIIKSIAAKYDKDLRVVRLIVYYPFKFIKRKIESMLDWRPIRLRYFGVFGLTAAAKKQYGGDNAQQHKTSSRKAIKEIKGQD